jgi:AsmA protein
VGLLVAVLSLAFAPKLGDVVSAATRIKRLGLAVAAAIAVFFIALITLSFVISAETVREQVKAQIHAVTGLDPVLSGDVSVSLFPTGRVRFDRVSFGDKHSGLSTLNVEQLVVRLRFFPFLIGRIEIADVTLVRPTITIGFGEGGGSNWAAQVDTLARALTPSPDRVKSFSEIRIADGTVMLHNENYNVVETLTNVDFTLAWPSISKTFGATGRFSWHEETIDAAVSLSDFVAALSGERSGLKLRLAGDLLKFAFDGYISHRPTLKMEGTLAADTASLRDTLRWAARWSAPGGSGFGPFAIKAQTNIVGRNISLSGVHVELDGNAGEGVIAFTNDGRQSLQGTLAVETLDLTPYVSTFRLLSGNDWNRRPIGVGGLNSVDVDIRLSAARVTLAHIKLGRTAVAANLRDGGLNIGIGESQAFGGVVTGTFGLARASAGAAVKAQLQFADVDLEQCLNELIGIRRIEGTGTITVTLDGSGGSVYEVTQSLNGNARIASKKGAIVGVNVEQLLRRLERNPLSTHSDFRGGKTPFDLFSIMLKVTQGVANFDDLRVEAPAWRIALSGMASIPERDLDLKGTASLLAVRDAAPTFELPFVVTGPWDEPLIWPDAQALIKHSGAAQPLLDAVRSRLKRDVGKAEAAKDSSPTSAPQ